MALYHLLPRPAAFTWIETRQTFRRPSSEQTRLTLRQRSESGMDGTGQCTDGTGQWELWRRRVGWMVQVRAVSGAGRFWDEGPAPLKRLEGRFLEQVSRVKSDLRHSPHGPAPLMLLTCAKYALTCAMGAHSPRDFVGLRPPTSLPPRRRGPAEHRMASRAFGPLVLFRCPTLCKQACNGGTSKKHRS